MFDYLCLHPRWWTSSTARCRTEWCWLEGTWWGMSAARTATASLAGFTSLLPKIARDTKRAVSSLRERWFERARALKSTSLQTTHETLEWMTSPPLSYHLCTKRHHLQTLSSKSWLHPSRTLPRSLAYDHRPLLNRRLFCWLFSMRKKCIPPKENSWWHTYEAVNLLL